SRAGKAWAKRGQHRRQPVSLLFEARPRAEPVLTASRSAEAVAPCAAPYRLFAQEAYFRLPPQNEDGADNEQHQTTKTMGCHGVGRDLRRHVDACRLLGVVAIAMTLQERCDSWLAERLLIQTHLAEHPYTNKAVLEEFRVDARVVERYIRHYEAAIAKEAA